MLSVLLPGVLAFVGSALGHLLARLTAREQQRWRRREETMRLLRWAADAASGTPGRRTELGMAALEALVASPLLDGEDDAFVRAVFVVAARDDDYAGDDGRGADDDGKA